jgi:hypothetical protein
VIARWVPLLALAACDPYDPCDGSALGPPNGLELAPETHPGWGSDRCFACHVRARLHDEACAPGVDLDALSRADLTPCSRCHGDNGNPQDEVRGPPPVGGDTGEAP